MVSSSLPILLLSWCYLIVISLGQDRITPGNPVKDNETIISVGETFVLGFFNPGNSSNRYVGIWYNNIPAPTVVWVANRDNPITDSAGSLSIDQSGNLVVLDGRNNTLWSTNITETVTGNEGVSASLLQSGNLILRHRNDKVLWESFDYPSDTFLPGMRLRMNLTTGAAWNISSWRDADDPAPGPFSLGIEHQSSFVQIIMWRGSDRLWRSGAWGGGFSGGITQSTNFVSYYTVVVMDQEIYMTFASSDDTVRVRSVLTFAGRVEQLLWREGSQRWELGWWVPNYNACDAYNACGPFGTCTWRGSEARCECLQGYVPKFKEEWSMRNWSSGCVRYRELDCEERGDGFLTLEQMTLPDLPLSVESRSSLGECEDQCRSNCSCFAYAFANVTGTANSTCLVWERDLIDLHSNKSRGHSLHLREYSSKLGGGTAKIRRKLIVIAIPIAVFTCLISCCIYCFWRRKRRDGTGRMEQNKTILTVNMNDHLNNPRISSSKDEIAPWVPLFQFSTISAATDNFTEANKLGQGGFGPVYKGRLMGQDVAVKRLSKSSGQGLMELRNEVELIAKLQHKNLVRLLGWCAHGDEKMLIYEYLPNKSLDKFLFDAKQKAQLDWQTRLKIIEGIAQGLLYLHRYSRLKIIHRDLKTSNILLDGDMNPKISDFGMARIFGGNQTEANTNKVVGTFGYMAPEYALDGNFSEKSDVFSFGVLLIETVTGKKNTGFYPSKHSIHLLGNVWHSWVEGSGMELIDPVCGEVYDAQKVLKCINVGLLCVQEDATDRPTMASVISMLDGDGSSLPKPNMPAFFNSTRTSRIASPAAVAETESNSVNQVTISTLAPR